MHAHGQIRGLQLYLRDDFFSSPTGTPFLVPKGATETWKTNNKYNNNYNNNNNNNNNNKCYLARVISSA